MTALDYLARHRAGGAPGFVLAKIEILNDLRDAAKGTLDSLQAKVDKARRERDELERDRARLVDSQSGLRFQSEVARDTDRRIAQIDEALEVANAAFEKAWQKLEAATEIWNARGQLCSHLDYWMRHHGDLAGLEQAERPTPPKPTGSQGWAGALASVRKDLARLDADAHAVKTAPMMAIEAKEAARRHVAELADKSRPDVRWLVEFGRQIEWPRGNLRDIGGAGAVAVAMPDARGLMAWLHPEAMVAALEAEIDAVADDGQAIGADEREARLAQIAAEKLQAERREEATIMAASAAGTTLERRPDADPRAVLAVQE